MYYLKVDVMHDVGYVVYSKPDDTLKKLLHKTFKRKFRNKFLPSYFAVQIHGISPTKLRGIELRAFHAVQETFTR